MPDTIKVGIITHAAGPHLDAYLKGLADTPEAASVVLSDPSGTTFDMAKKALGDKLTATYKDAGELLKEKPQMALITMEAVLTPPAVDAALEAGCHVFIEKPAALRAEDFEPLVRKAQVKHRHLMAALANRLHPSVREARRIVKEGLLGKIYGADIHFVADQTRLTREGFRKSWLGDKARAGGGNFTWLGIHWLDLALFVSGLKVKQTAGFAGIVGGQAMNVEDSVACALRFDNGGHGTFHCGYYLDKGYQSYIHLWGEHGWLKLYVTEELPLEWYSSRDPKTAAVKKFEYPKGSRGYTPFVRAAVRASAGLAEAPITGEEFLHVLRTIYSFYKSAETGQSQEVK